MKKRKQITDQLRDNRGSGVVVVLIAMMIVTMLAATVSYMSFIGFQLRATERLSESEFYDAEEALNEIRSGVQLAVSDSIQYAYEDILVNYNNPSYLAGYADMSLKFQDVFRDELRNWGVDLVQPDGSTARQQLFTDATNYNISVLSSFTTKAGAAVTTTNPAWLYDPTEKKILLKNIRVTYTGRNDYQTSITSDIAIGLPDFAYIFSEYSISGLPEFAVIAKDYLSQPVNSTRLTIRGSAYAGNMLLTGADSALTITGGSMVCGDKISVQGKKAADKDARFIVNSDASLWANRIEVEAQSSAQLEGTAYMGDDLELKGIGAAATLGGNYYGFGNSLTDAAQSSAILVNATGTKLDMSGLNRLMLAGHSFVGTYYTNLPGTYNANMDVLMGESVSVRQNQQAYLVPEEYFENITANPYVAISGDPIDMTLTPEGQTKMAAYQARVKRVPVNIPGMAGQTMNYFFMEFGGDSAANANKFFKDFFESNRETIKRYLETYTELDVNLRMSSQTVGYTLYEIPNADPTAETQYGIGNYVSADSLITSVQQMRNTYNQLRQTLFERDPLVSGTTPYEYFVKHNASGKVETVKNGTTIALADDHIYYFYPDGDTTQAPVAMIINNSTAFPTSRLEDAHGNTSIKLMIAAQSITVDQHPFNGLLISGGTVEMHQHLFAAEDDVTKAMEATCPELETSYPGAGDIAFKDFLREGSVTSNTQMFSGSTGTWSLDKLVTYHNWKKNE